MAKRMIKPRASLLAAVAVATLLAACGGGDKGEKASQTAAKVNKEEITVHQINFVLQRQPNLKPEQAEVASRQVLERLIDQELALQKAEEQKLDRDPRVVQQIEAAKREIIARAYVERVGESAAKPTAEEIAKYYAEKPALFKDRRIYSLQELQIEAKPEQLPVLREKLTASKTLPEFIEYLKANDIRFAGNQAVRAAEQLPLSSLDNIARLKDGESTVTITPAGMTVLTLAGSRSQPVDEARARPAIEAFLLNQRKAELVQKDIKALRDSSKIEYVGKFAQPAPGAASAPAAQPIAPTTDAAAPAPAASGLDPASISKGMGLK
jgi:EpsD family peptidyl-prolyl cis-trans isomerase